MASFVSTGISAADTISWAVHDVLESSGFMSPGRSSISARLSMMSCQTKMRFKASFLLVIFRKTALCDSLPGALPRGPFRQHLSQFSCAIFPYACALGQVCTE